MATLTPGVLLKLLQSMNTDTKVKGEHRSAILQVIGIVPAPAGHDLWPSNGFYIQLSDSVNSTYVSLSDADADLILSNRPQLGQFVHLDRLHFDPPSSVPRASGLRPLPGRPQPFLGSPEPLVVRISPNHTGFIIQTASSDLPPPPPPETMTVFVAGENAASVAAAPVKNQPSTTVKRRFLSPASVKIPGRKSSGGSADRQPSPVLKAGARPSTPPLGRSSSRPSSPAPSKCDVPSLVAAKEENRKVAREPSIVVPSRYRQPSPVSVRRAASPVSRRTSSSPGRRLSGGFRVSPLAGEGKKKIATMGVGISKVSDVLMGSSKSVRKGRDDGSSNLASNSERKEKGRSKTKPKNEDINHIMRTQAAMPGGLSDVDGKQTNDEDVSLEKKATGKTTHNTNCSAAAEKSSSSPKIYVHDPKWTDGSFPLDVLPENLERLGKEALHRKNAAATAAAEALEEACATESVVRNLSQFSDLCSTAKIWRPLPTIDRFLTIYNDVTKRISIVESLATSRRSDGKGGVEPAARRTLVSLWIDAALATDLEVVSPLLDKGTVDLSEQTKALKVSKKVVGNLPRRRSLGTTTKGAPRQGAAGGDGVGETVELAQALRTEMEVWFLKFVEQALDAGLQLLGDSRASAPAVEMSSAAFHQDKTGRVAALLSHLKLVNQWLDGIGKKMDDSTPIRRESIERLRKKIYGFVIRHVGSAFDDSVSPASSAS